MKVNPILSLIGFALASLLGYLIYTIAEGKGNDLLYGIGGTICFISTLLPCVGLKYDSGRMGINIRILSSLFFIILFAIHICFAAFVTSIPFYVITNGIFLIIFLAIFYKMQGNKEI